MKLIFSLLLAAFALNASAQNTIAAKDAPKHIGEKVVICDKVFGGKFFSNSQITLLDVGGNHPNEMLTLVIKGDDRKKFATAPDEAFNGKLVCVTGELIDYKGKPEIMITDPAQIKLNE